MTRKKLEDLYWGALLGTLTPAEEEQLDMLTIKSEINKKIETMEDTVAKKVIKEWQEQHGIR